MRNQFIFETRSDALQNEEQTGGDNSESIRRLQQALNRRLETNLPLDGRLGFRTRRALRNFQRQKGLPADGIVGRETNEALFATHSMQTPQSNSMAFASSKETGFGYETGYLSFNDELEFETKTNCKKDWCDPNYIRWVQQSLNRILGLQLKEDGYVEKKTISAIRSFQAKYRLKVDASLGPATEKALIAAGATNPPEIKQMPCGSTNTDELAKLLNKYRGDIPLNFLLGWIKIESGGRIDSLTYLCERGYFQVHPEEAVDYGIKNHQDISYNPDYSIQAGLEIVKRCVARAKALADKYGLPKQGDLFWGLVKLHHWIPNGPKIILDDMKARGVKPASWNDIKTYVAVEKNRKRLIKTLKGFDPMNGINNADKTLNNAGTLNAIRTSNSTGSSGNPKISQSPVSASGKVNRHTVEYGKWVQRSLNKILGLQLVVDGNIGTKTRSAIRSFQQKKGLRNDGIMGARTEAALIAATRTQPPAGGTATPGAGRTASLINTPLPREGPGFYSYRKTSRQYGIPETIRALQAIGKAWYAAHPQGPRIGIGEISLQGGGKISGHVSHQKGVDIDIGLMRNDSAEKPTRYQNPEYSRTLTQELVNLIYTNGILKVMLILFNDPQVKGVRKWAGHDNHLHVRFCAPADSACKPASQSEFEFAADQWEMMDEYEFNSLDYIRWVQSSLNKILGLRLAVDGKLGNQTRSAIRSFQQRAGLTADGKVGAQTERALIAAGASQPTGSGAATGSNAPLSSASSASTPALLNRETEPPQETLYANIRLGGEGPATAMTGIFIPQGYKPQSQVDLIIYLHGFKINPPPVTMSIDGYWNTRKVPYFPLREALNKSGKNVILVAPTLGPHSQTGWLTGAGGFDRYITQVLTALSASDTFKGITPSVRHIILACHSGGGLPMRTLALSGGRYAQNIKECWGFDCTYNTGDDTLWSRWAQSRADAKLFIYYIAGSRTQALSLKLRAKNVPNVAVIAASTGAHNRVPITHWEERLRGAEFLANRSEQISPFNFNNEAFENGTSMFENNLFEISKPKIPKRNRPNYIKWVQGVLNQALGLRLAVDGKMGSQTRYALRNFQKKHGLTPDGIVGKKTEQALIKANPQSAMNISKIKSVGTTSQEPKKVNARLLLPSLSELGEVGIGVDPVNVITTVFNNEGDIEWELDQMKDAKHPWDQQTWGGGTWLSKSEDYYVWMDTVLGDEISAKFRVNYRYNGHSIGYFHIENINTEDAALWGLKVTAKIFPDPNAYIIDGKQPVAAVEVNFNYRFYHPFWNDKIYSGKLKFYGNGRVDSSGRWTQW